MERQMERLNWAKGVEYQNQSATQQTWGHVMFQHRKTEHIALSGRNGGSIGAQHLIFAPGHPSRSIRQCLKQKPKHSENQTIEVLSLVGSSLMQIIFCPKWISHHRDPAKDNDAWRGIKLNLNLRKVCAPRFRGNASARFCVSGNLPFSTPLIVTQISSSQSCQLQRECRLSSHSL